MSRLLLLLFIVVNVALYALSYEGTTFIEGADATQYYIPALSFLENGQFMLGHAPLTFGPPLYSIFLALPIGLFGLDASTVPIIFLQAVLLYVTGYLFRLIFLLLYSGGNAGETSNVYALLLHALIIFNPNSVITAHLVQSETLFTFLFAGALYFAIRFFFDSQLKYLIYIGLLAGLATLTRPVSLYFLWASPLFLWIVMKLQGADVKKLQLMIPLLVGITVISPWYVRNYVEFGEVFYTSNAGAYLKAQYLQLKHKGSGWSRAEADEQHRLQYEQYLEKKKVEKRQFCLEHERDWLCNSLSSRASLQFIVEEPPAAHFKTLIDSWGTLFLSGGASNIRNYFGIEGKSAIVGFQNRPFKGIESIKLLIDEMSFGYLLIFVVTMGFAVVTRVIGAVGLFYLLTERKWLPYGVFFVEVVSLFTAAYLYLGQSRFRVPLEPMLMLLTLFGLIYFINRKKVI